MPVEPNRPSRQVDNTITRGRVIAWIVIGGIGLVLVIMGIVGIVAKG